MSALTELRVDGVTVAVGQVYRDVDEQWLVKFGDRRRLRVFRIDPRRDSHVAWCEDLNCKGVSPFFPVEDLADAAKFVRCPELETKPTHDDERTAA